VFLSKIWLFLVALGAAVALTIALVMPRPAQRTLVTEEQRRLAVACSVIDILLADDARNRVELAGTFGRAPEVVGALENASAAEHLDESRMKQVRDVGETIMKGISGRKPDFAMLIDRRGRVVARVRLDQDDFGDVVAGRPLIDDALAGFLRDDLWAQNGTMYFVAAAPVIRRDPPVAYVGAVVLGHKVTNDLAKKLVGSLNVDTGFYLGNDDVAGSQAVAFDHGVLGDAVGKLQGGDVARDCQANQPFDLAAGKDEYTAVVARLPGEAQAHRAFFSVFIKKPEARGFMGTLHAVRQGDLSTSSFPWFLVADRPLRGLAADAVRLAKGEQERLREDSHGGKFGSIARSVNIHIDKVGREAKSARTNLDQLLGPAPEGSLGTIDLLSSPLPPRPGSVPPVSVPPPSDFRFGGEPAPPPPPPVAARSTPPQWPAQPPVTPPRGSRTPPPQPVAQAPLRLDDDILGGEVSGPIDPYFKQVYDQFISVKRSCNEPVVGLTYQKFAEKLVRNRDDLMAKTGCREVRFTVYVKDGKAALKATPVRDEA